MSNKGKIITWNDEKGFGFVKPLKDQAQIFIHISAFNDRKLRPDINQKVTYELSVDKQGRKSAIKIARTSDRKIKTKKGKNSAVSMIISITFLIIISCIIFIKQASFLILYAYIIISLVSFLIYGWDKSAAKKNHWRTPENHLHFLSLIGGWPGALIAQNFFRHKSKKQPFRIIFWVTVMINISLFIGLMARYGFLIEQITSHL